MYIFSSIFVVGRVAAMAPAMEWRGRIEHRRDTLKKLFYRKLGDVNLPEFVTRARLTPLEG